MSRIFKGILQYSGGKYCTKCDVPVSRYILLDGRNGYTWVVGVLGCRPERPAALEFSVVRQVTTNIPTKNNVGLATFNQFFALS